MWIFTPVAFVSVAFSRQDPNAVQFRFRTQEQAEAFNQFYQVGAEVMETAHADYRWRIILHEADASALLDRLCNRYFEDAPTNVKAHAEASGASSALMAMMHRVWALGMQMQTDEGLEDLLPEGWDKPRQLFLAALREHGTDHIEQVCTDCWHYGEEWDFAEDDRNGPCCPSCGSLSIPHTTRVCSDCGTQHDDDERAGRCCNPF